jgi:FAD/FMN-containing dehydrogenase
VTTGVSSTPRRWAALWRREARARNTVRAPPASGATLSSACPTRAIFPSPWAWLVSCRFTHIYPDGPAPYFSYSALGSNEGNLADSLAKWRAIKQATNEIAVALGGTVTHHHAVGRDHRSGYERQSSPLFRAALAAAKSSLDPAGVMNPGVLIDPIGRAVGARGAMG